MSYELTYIVPLKFTENEIPQIASKISDTLKKHSAEIVKEEILGKRKIAYPIKQNRHGYFVVTQLNFEEPANLQKLNLELNTIPEILRFSITKYKAGAFDATKKSRSEESFSQEKSEEMASQRTPAFHTQPESLSFDQEEEALKIKASKEKKAKEDKSKVSLEDLDKKLDEILSDTDLAA